MFRNFAPSPIALIKKYIFEREYRVIRKSSRNRNVFKSLHASENHAKITRTIISLIEKIRFLQYKNIDLLCYVRDGN